MNHRLVKFSVPFRYSGNFGFWFSSVETLFLQPLCYHERRWVRQVFPLVRIFTVLYGFFRENVSKSASIRIFGWICNGISGEDFVRSDFVTKLDFWDSEGETLDATGLTGLVAEWWHCIPLVKVTTVFIQCTWLVYQSRIRSVYWILRVTIYSGPSRQSPT